MAACTSLRHTPRSSTSVAVLNVIVVGQHEPAGGQLERVLQVLRNSGTAEPSCLESFVALAEHVSISRGGRHRFDSTLNAVQPMGWERSSCGRRLGTRRISPKVATPACSDVIIARRGSRSGSP